MSMTALLAAVMMAQRPKPLAELPFVQEPGRIWLKAHLNGKPVEALLDTGAQFCVAEADTASTAGAKKGVGNFEMHGIGAKKIGVWPTTDLMLSLDGLEVTAEVRFATDLSRVQAKEMRRIGALVGGDFLRRFVVEIDYPNSRVRFYEPASYIPRNGTTTMPLRLVNGAPVVPMSLSLPGQSEKTVSALVDTGMTGVTLTGSYVHREDLLKQFPAAKPFDASGGLGGKSSGRLLPDVSGRVGIQDFKGPVLLVTEKSGSTGADAPYDVLIGGNMLGNCVATFDYARGTMTMEYPPTPS